MRTSVHHGEEEAADKRDPGLVGSSEDRPLSCFDALAGINFCNCIRPQSKRESLIFAEQLLDLGSCSQHFSCVLSSLGQP